MYHKLVYHYHRTGTINQRYTIPVFPDHLHQLTDTTIRRVPRRRPPDQRGVIYIFLSLP